MTGMDRILSKSFSQTKKLSELTLDIEEIYALIINHFENNYSQVIIFRMSSASMFLN